MKFFYENLVGTYVSNPELLLLPLLLLVITHVLISKRNASHTLLEARVKAYRSFINEYSVCFSSPSFKRISVEMQNIENNLIEYKSFVEDLYLFSETVQLTTEHKKRLEEVNNFLKESGKEFKKTKAEILTHEKAMEVTKIFGECRLVAGELLGEKLRGMYTKISDELNSGKVKKGDTEYRMLGLEIEQYMRYDLGSINYFDLIIWRLYFTWKKLSARATIKPGSKSS